MKNQTGNALLTILVGFLAICGLILAYSAYDNHQYKKEQEAQQAKAELEQRSKNSEAQQQEQSEIKKSHQNLTKFHSQIATLVDDKQTKDKVASLQKIQGELYNLKVAECLKPAKQNLIKYIDHRVSLEAGSNASKTAIQIDIDSANAQAKEFNTTMHECRKDF